VTGGIYVGLGSNLGDRRATLAAAVRRLRQLPGLTVERVSPLYQTSPVGGPAQDDYLNAVVELSGELAPQVLLSALQQIEAAAGRTRETRWGPRTLDLDILLYADTTVNTVDLQVPHPRLAERRFVLEPLCALAPALTHPTLGRSMSELLAALPAGDRVERVGDERWAS
jgi:2-amino-4-hydroxy-6-hydroxymethyldihydropteridine diphosphokinase